MHTTDPSGPSPRRHQARAAAAARIALVLAAALATGRRTEAQMQLAPDPISLWQGLHGTSEILEEALALDLDRDGVQDLLLRADGDRLVWGSALGHRQHRRVLALPAGVATVDAHARLRLAPGTPDALLSANANGLHRWSHDTASGAFSATTWLSPAGGVAAIACGRPGAVSGLAYALHADRRTVTPVAYDATTGVATGALPSFALAEEIARLAAFDYDGDGAPEVAALVRSSLRVHAASGALALSVPRAGTGPTSGDRMAVLRDDGVADEELAWTTLEPAGFVLHVVGRNIVDPSYVLGAADVLHADAGDLDRDGLADLVLGEAIGPRVRVLRALCDGSVLPRFRNGAGNDDLIDASGILGAAGAITSSSVAVADVDGDGDLDVAHVGHAGLGTGHLALLRNGAVDEEQERLRLDHGYVLAPPGGPPGPYQVRVRLGPPQGSVSASALRYRVWQRLEANVVEVLDAPVAQGTLPVPSAWPFDLDLLLAASGKEEARWYVAVDLVDASGATPIGRSALVAGAWLEDLGVMLIEATPGAGLWGGPNGGGGGGAAGSGGVGQVPRVPPPEEDDPIPPSSTLP